MVHWSEAKPRWNFLIVLSKIPRQLHTRQDMLALRAKIEEGWALISRPVFQNFYFSDT